MLTHLEGNTTKHNVAALRCITALLRSRRSGCASDGLNDQGNYVLQPTVRPV